MEGSRAPRYAVHCLHLQRIQAYGRGDDTLTICQHPVREGKDCVGPFLEDLETGCGLWEPDPQSYLVPLPKPEGWQRRPRREGFDYQRARHSDAWR